MNFDWSQLAFASKKPLRELQATFIAAPRELSAKRFGQLVKEYLPQGNIVLGLAKEPYVDGLEDQPQFRMLGDQTVQPVIDKVAASATKHKVYSLSYLQRELPYILEKVAFRQVLLVNGSWHHSFHLSPSYYVLASQRTPFTYISPFVDEAEAQAFEATLTKEITASLPPLPTSPIGDQAMLELANAMGKQSYDYTTQTGVALAKPAAGGKSYRLVATAYSRVVPYQTYAWHHGSSREQHFSPPNDLNFYDTNHAEVNLLLAAVRQGIKLADTSLFINLLPCPTCGRMLAQTDITEVVYHLDHSDGYTFGVLEAAGKKIRRISI